jgi:hypothetical protein
MFSCGKTRAEGDYSQGKWRTQGKIAKKAEKMQIFWWRVEITAENAAPRVGAELSNGFRRWITSGPMPHPANLGKADGTHWRRFRGISKKSRRLPRRKSGRSGATPLQ